MDDEDLNLLITFVIRQRRFLRTLETSFTPRELDTGRRALKLAMRAARKQRLKLGTRAFRDELATQAGRARLAEQVAREAKVVNKRHAFLMLENFELFNQVLTGGTGPVVSKPKTEDTIEAPLCTAVDRFYSPVARAYR